MGLSAPCRWAIRCALVGGLLLGWNAGAQQPELGHKTLGTLGVGAGSQPEPGVYAADRFFWYSANELRDRTGASLPVGLDLDAVSNVVGAIGVFKLPFSTYFNVAAGGPIASIRTSTDQPEASTDRFGLGDVYVQPVKLGWRLSYWDFVVGYALYIPTGHFEPFGGEGVGRGHWSHEFSAGGTAYFDSARTWSLSALASYELNLKKRGIDITRGDTVQIQGGIGKMLFRFIEPGLTAYALWQVRDDRGADLPEALRGARDHVVGLGAQVGALVPPIRGRLTLSYSHDLAVRSRPLGQLLLVSLTIAAWKPASYTLGL